MFGYWEKVDKKKCLQVLENTQQLIGYYERCHSAVLNKVIPSRLHSAISGLGIAIEKSKSFYAWYSELKAVADALDTLNKSKMNDDPVEKAKAFGKLFVALAVIGEHVPEAHFYAQTLKQFGEHFDKIAETILPSAHGSEGLEGDYKSFLKGDSSFINGR